MLTVLGDGECERHLGADRDLVGVAVDDIAEHADPFLELNERDDIRDLRGEYGAAIAADDRERPDRAAPARGTV